MIGSQSPRIRLAAGDGASRGVEAVEVAAAAGLVLDEWQRDVLMEGCRVDGDGKWAALQVGLNVTRQNGKGAVLEARELAGLFAFGERFITHSAQQFDTSLEAFRRLLDLIESCPDFDSQVAKVRSSHGEEGIELKSGQRIRYRTRSKSSGRGFSGDLVVFDEAMFISTWAHGALVPIVSAQPNPQLWYAGSAVDQKVHDHGLVFTEIRNRGRDPETKRLVYFEWSLDYENPADVPEDVMQDPVSQALANPAFGVRITPEYVAAEVDALDSRSCAVERFGVGDYPDLDAVSASPISLDDWNVLMDDQSRPLDPVCLAFDISPDRRAAIAAAGRRADQLLHVEVVDQRPGTKWLPGRLAELWARYGPHEIVCDGYGPAASVLVQLQEAGVPVRKLSGQEHAQACGQLVDLVSEKQVRHLGSMEVQQALRGAKGRPLGDAWAWSRKNSSTDISPLVASTLALSSAAGLPVDTSDPVIY